MSGLINYGALKIEKIDKNKLKIDLKGNETEEEKKAREERNSKIEQQDMPYHINIEDYLSKIDEEKYKNRVELYLNKLDSSISSVMNKFSTDPIISKCIYGRDLRQIKGTSTVKEYEKNADGSVKLDDKGNPQSKGIRARRDKTEGRFPNLLDSVSNIVMKNAIDVAQSVYAYSYAKELKKMTDSQLEEVKKAMCYAMTSSATTWKCIKWSENFTCLEWSSPYIIEIMFTDKIGQTLGERGGKYSTSYTIAGASFADMTKLTKSANKILYTTDPKNSSMLGSSQITTVYSDGICYLKTVNTTCKNIKDIWEDKEIARYKGGGGFITIFGVGGWGYNHPVVRSQYSGQRCTEFNPPKETTQEIKM